MKSLFTIPFLVLFAGCVTHQPDHFYVLAPQPAAVETSRSQFDRQVTVRVGIPALIDRGEMVVAAENGGVSVMDHERWAAPLADMVISALGQDIERRRADVVVVPRSAGKAAIPLVTISVEIDQVSARLAAPLTLETHWRVTDTGSGKQSLGRETFTSPQQLRGYADVAAAFSACIALLAERLVQEIPSG